jgi:hypothetical protein
LFAIFEELHERAVDVAIAEEAEVVGCDSDFLAQGLKPYSSLDACVALKRRSSAVRPSFGDQETVYLRRT